MKGLRNIFILIVSLLSINGVMVNDVSLHEIAKKSEIKVVERFNHISVDNFVEDTTPNEDFDLEEDCDDTDDDFMGTLFSPKLIIASTSPHTNSYYYSYSHQSVKRFILYCSLKLYC
jgi:hypothetical protein